MAAIDKSLYEKFEIKSVDGSKTADIKAGVVVFNYFEDLLIQIQLLQLQTLVML